MYINLLYIYIYIYYVYVYLFYIFYILYIYIYIYYIYILYIIHVFNGIWYTAWCCIEAQIQVGPSTGDVGDSLWNTWMNQGP